MDDDLSKLIKTYLQFGLETTDAINKAREDKDKAALALFRHTEEMAKIAGKSYFFFVYIFCLLK
jgi:hypothetical protein